MNKDKIKYSLKVAYSIKGPFPLYPKFKVDLFDRVSKTEAISFGLFTQAP